MPIAQLRKYDDLVVEQHGGVEDEKFAVGGQLDLALIGRPAGSGGRSPSCRASGLACDLRQRDRGDQSQRGAAGGPQAKRRHLDAGGGRRPDLLWRQADDDDQAAPAREPLAADRLSRSPRRDDNNLAEAVGDAGQRSPDVQRVLVPPRRGACFAAAGMRAVEPARPPVIKQYLPQAERRRRTQARPDLDVVISRQQHRRPGCAARACGPEPCSTYHPATAAAAATLSVVTAREADGITTVSPAAARVARGRPRRSCPTASVALPRSGGRPYTSLACGVFSTAISRPPPGIPYEAPSRSAASAIRCRLPGFSTPSGYSVRATRDVPAAARRSPRRAPHDHGCVPPALRAAAAHAAAGDARSRAPGHGPA